MELVVDIVETKFKYLGFFLNHHIWKVKDLIEDENAYLFRSAEEETLRKSAIEKLEKLGLSKEEIAVLIPPYILYDCEDFSTKGPNFQYLIDNITNMV
jgi:hypothetical protein